MAGSQVAQDRAGFPQRFAVTVAQDRHGAVGVHGQELRRVGAAVAVSGIVPLVRQAKLADAPHERLDVGRGLSAPDRQHSPFFSLGTNLYLGRFKYLDRQVLHLALAIRSYRQHAAGRHRLSKPSVSNGSDATTIALSGRPPVQ